MTFALPQLPYAYNSLEPFIDEQTMKIHHDKHHQAYTDKLNAGIEPHKELGKKTAEELLSDLNSIPESIRTAVKNNGGGYVNHSFFWTILKKGTVPKGEILKAITKKFQSLDNFKTQFKDAALTLFGSGWVWVVLDPKTKQIEILKTSNQDSPLSLGKIPLMCVDVWEHAYYLKYQNRRGDYIDAFFNVLNWNAFNENFTVLMKK